MNAPFDILITQDGRVFAHNLTPALAAVLTELNPADEVMRLRVGGEMADKVGMEGDGATNNEQRTTNA